MKGCDGGGCGPVHNRTPIESLSWTQEEETQDSWTCPTLFGLEFFNYIDLVSDSHPSLSDTKPETGEWIGERSDHGPGRVE